MITTRVRAAVWMAAAAYALAGFGLQAQADGTETLGPASIPIAAGSGIAHGGIGLIDEPEGDIFVAVPAGAEVKQVLLYWISEFYPQSGPDDQLSVNGIPVVGTGIGGPTNFFSVVYYEAFRADITDLGLVQAGGNVLSISDATSSFRTTGAGVTVIYDDGGAADLQLIDGLDLAYWRFSGLLNGTVPQTFFFDASEHERDAEIGVHVGSVEDNRPNVVEVTIGNEVHQYWNLLTSMDGPEWDAQSIPLTIPAGVSQVTLELISDFDGTDRNPASLAWVMGSFALFPPDVPDVECGPCDGQVNSLTLRYDGSVSDAFIQVRQRVQGPARNAYAFEGVVQPGATFSFSGVNNQATLGPDIEIFVNGSLNTNIHTSCSQEIGPGLKRGDFTVVRGSSRHGGELCPIDGGPGDPGDPGDPCGPCDGQVNALTLRYDGDIAAEVLIAQRVQGPRREDYPFEGVVQPGASFGFSGLNNQGTLGPEIDVYVDGVLNTRIHTSCSQEIGPGMVLGLFTILAGSSRNGGELCPVNGGPGGPGDPGGPDDPGVVNYCDAGKPDLLTMVYTGEGCEASDTVQGERHFTCEGDPAGTPEVRIIAVDKDDPFHHRAYVFFDGVVGLNESFDISAAAGGLTRLKGDTRVFIFGLDGTLLQALKFHTSCSQPLRPGDQFGALQLVGFEASGSQRGPTNIIELGGEALDVKPGGAGCSAGPAEGRHAWGDAALVALLLAGLTAASMRRRTPAAE